MALFAFFSILLTLLAFGFVLPALWRGSRRLALALVLGIPLLAASLYHYTGNPLALDPRNTMPIPQTAPTTIEEAIAQLEQRLEAAPDDVDALVLLGRSYMALQKFDRARDSFARAIKLRPDDTDLSVEYAESLLRTAPDRRFPPAAIALLETAVARNPENQRALFFLGLHYMQAQQPRQAAASWEALLPLLTPETAAALQPQIDEARAAAALPPLPDTAHAIVAATLRITVDLDPAMADAAGKGAVLYVFARRLAGAGPPLAAKRIVVDRWPVQLSLDDSDSPMPTAKLSSQTQVLLVARLSKSGDVMPASGDIESPPMQITTGRPAPVSLSLSRRIP